MSSFGFVMHSERGADLAAGTVGWLVDRGHEVRMGHSDAAVLGLPELGVDDDKLAVGLDLLLSLGGDGTMLRSVALAAPEDVPVLGVNLGRLGYLTEIEPVGIRMALKRFLAGSYTLEDRHRIRVELHRGDSEVEQLDALNEAVVEKSQIETDRQPRCRTRWPAIHLIRVRRTHPGDPDRFDGLRVLGTGTDHRSTPPGDSHGPGRGPHALRPLAGPATRL